jgi:lysozyme family protein
MANFDIAFNHTLKLEGKYSNHAADPGGETMYGITKRDHPEAFKNGLPTLEMAKAIYYKNYWSPLGCENLNSQNIANELFDTGVNMGIGMAAKFAQRAFNRLKPAQWEALIEDGTIGPKSVLAFNTLSKNYEAAFFNYMNYLQAARYDSLHMDTFLRGWFGNRIQAI